MRRILAWLVLVTLWAVPAAAQHHMTPYDDIPDFCAVGVTKTSTGAGDWFASGTWTPSGVPTASDVVSIQHAVTFGATGGAAAILCIRSGGSLTFSTSATTGLTVTTLIIESGGTLQHGVPGGACATGEIVIRDTAIDTDVDPSQYGHGILTLGTWIGCGTTVSPTFVRTTVEPLNTATTVTVDPAPTLVGWGAGTRIGLPATFSNSNLGITEEHMHVAFNCPAPCVAGTPHYTTIASRAANVITLTDALTQDHKGGRGPDGSVEHFPHVANLSRSFVIRSENPAGVRGHTLATQRATVDLEYLRFSGLGRTTDLVLDPTTFDGGGAVTHIGTNVKGRYAFHAHHLIGPTNAMNTGYQYKFVGNAIEDGQKWCLAVHGSAYGLIQDNVVTNCDHGGIATEDGNETANAFVHNFAFYVRNGDAWYIQGLKNTFTGNVGADAFSSQDLTRLCGTIGFDGNCGAGFATYGRHDSAHGTMIFPLIRGADTSVVTMGETEAIDMNSFDAPSFLQFDSNEFYGAFYGVWFDHRGGGAGGTDGGGMGHVLTNTTLWRVALALHEYNTNGATITGWIARDCDIGLSFPGTALGRVITNADVQNCIVGLVADGGTGEGVTGNRIAPMPLISLSASVLRNRRSNLEVHGIGPVSNGDAVGSGRQQNTTYNHFRLDHVTMQSMPDAVSPTDIVLLELSDPTRLYYFSTATNFKMEVRAHNGVVGDDFAVYYAAQAPDTAMASTQEIATYLFQIGKSDMISLARIGCPEAGLSTGDCFAKHHAAIASGLAFCTTARAGIIGGYACPITATLDLEPPLMTALAVTPYSTVAQVTFTTDEPGDSLVMWTRQPTYSEGFWCTALRRAYVTSHVQWITGLQPSTAYFYRVISGDPSGNRSYEPAGGNYASFTTTTDADPPVPSVDARRPVACNHTFTHAPYRLRRR